MSISQQIFGKLVYDLTLTDMEHFFQEPQEETSILEFKTGDIQLEKIHREVAAFLNTEGGLLIIGAPQESKSGNSTICQGVLTPTDQIKNQDRLLQSIAGNIAPAPVGIKATTLVSKGKNIFVVEVPQSRFPPHQVSNEGKYYIRLEREAKAAPHGIIEALFNQRRTSKVVAKVGPLIKGNANKPSIYIFLENESAVHAKEMGFMLEICGVRTLDNAFNFSNDVQVTDGSLKWHRTDDRLLVKGMKYSVQLDISLRISLFYLNFSFYAADSPMETIEFIYDTQKKEYLHKFYSQKDESENIVLPEAVTIFHQKQRQYWAEQLGVDYSENDAESIMTKVYDFATTYRFKIPESLIDMFVIEEGYSETVNARSLELFSIETLEAAMKMKNDLFSENELVIGFLGDYPILLITQDYNSGIFKWTNQPTSARNPVDKESSCFYDILEDFLNE